MTADCASRPREVPPSGLTIVRPRGALDINAAPALREHLLGVLHRGPGQLILDLSHVSSCDVVGLAVLIGAQRRARQLGLSVRFVAPSPAVANVLRSTGLERSFTICQDRFGTLASGLDEPPGPAPVPDDAGRR